MTDVNVNASAGQAPTMAPPTCTDDQILPHIRWVPIGKSNYYLDVEKSQSNPIYKIVVDILKHTNFFRAFNASSTIPSIYIHQFWDTRIGIPKIGQELVQYTMANVNVNAPASQAPAMAPPVRTDDQILPRIRWVPIGKSNCYLDLDKSQSNPIYEIARALTTIINLCLMGKTYGFERPRASVLQIIWGVVNRAHLDYAERIWEEFTQSIHTFIKDKRNLAQHTHGKKKATLIVILRSDPDSPAPKPTKTAKKSKPTAPKADPRPPVSKPASSKQTEPRPAPAKTQGKKHKLRALEESLKSIYDIPRGPLPLVVIREPEPDKYQPLPEVPGKGKENVTEEQVSRDLLTLQTPKKKSPADRCIFQRRTSAPTGSSGHNESSSLYVELGLMDSEEEFDEDAGPDPGAQDGGQARSNPDEQAEGQAGPDPGNAEASQPMPSLVVHAGSNRKHMDLDVTDVSTQPLPEQMDEWFTATAYPKVQENLKLTVEEHVILEEPASSLGTLSSLQHLTKDLSFGDLFFSDKPLEADNDKATAKIKAESMVPGKGKEKVTEEQVSRDLLTLQTPKKKSPADRYIFQRRTSAPTGSSGHNESSSLYVELGLMDSEEEFDEDVPGTDAGIQDLEHMDLDVVDVSTQPHPEQMDEGFTATAYPKVQENLKLTVEEHVILEEPASSSGTLSSLRHLTKDLSFGDMFFSDKPSEADNDKATAETEAESMVSVTIQQDTPSIPPMTTSIIDLTSRPESPKVHQLLKATATETTTTTITIHPPPSQQQQSTTDSIMMKRIGKLEHIMVNLIHDNKQLEQRLDSHGARLYTLKHLDIPRQVSKAVNEVVTDAVDWAMQAPLRNRFRDLPEADMKDILHQRMWETDSYKTHEDHIQMYEALENLMNRDRSE
nr:histone deacetylase 14 [Tanacetum cinerariifolium]